MQIDYIPTLAVGKENVVIFIVDTFKSNNN